jgi:hypothetical protein
MVIEIGLPLVNKVPEVNEYDIARNTLPYVDLYPLDTSMVDGVSDGLLLYKLVPAQNGPPRLRIYFQHNGPITETFNNNLTDSFLASILRVSNSLSQITQILGNVPVHEFFGQLANQIPILGPILTGITAGTFNMLPETMQNAILSALRGDRFELPKIWQDSTATISYQITTTLTCNNPRDDVEYRQRIVEPLKYLLMYTLPRTVTNNSVTYMWPFFVMADAGALFWVPEGIITDLTIEKAPEQGTLSVYANRPSMVNVRLTITSVRNTVVQSYQGNVSNLKLTLDSYVGKLQSSDIRQARFGLHPSASKQQVGARSNIPSKNVSESDKSLYESLKS